MMDYRALEALVTVIQSKGFDRAAQVLNITQSAISQRVKQLEARFGQPLILRQIPPVATELGKQLIRHFQTVQHLEHDLPITSESHKRVQARIAVNADSLATWFAEALGAITDSVDFEIVVADQDSGIEWMKRGEVLACLCSESRAVNGARVDTLGTLRYRAYASQSFLDRHKLIDDLKNLHKTPCLIFNQDDRLQHRFLEILGQPKPQCPTLCPSSEGFIQLAAYGCGFGLMPEIQAAAAVKTGQLVDITPDTYIDTPLFWHSWQTAGSAMLQLRNSVIKTARQRLAQVSQ